MPKVTITDIAPWDGEYRLNLEDLTNDDLHRIKVLSGVRAGEIPEAIAAVDSDVICALALVTLEYAKQLSVNPADLWKAKIGAVKIDFEFKYPDEIEAEKGGAEAVPPPLPSSEHVESELGSRPSDSGLSSTDTSAQSLSGPSLTGGPGSETDAVSTLETSDA